MCFAPRRRALSHHLNFQKWSEPGVLCTCWLGNVLRATTACTFSSSQLPKVVRTWCVLYMLTANVLRATTACTFSTSQLQKVLRAWCALMCFVHFERSGNVALLNAAIHRQKHARVNSKPFRRNSNSLDRKTIVEIGLRGPVYEYQELSSAVWCVSCFCCSILLKQIHFFPSPEGDPPSKRAMRKEQFVTAVWETCTEYHCTPTKVFLKFSQSLRRPPTVATWLKITEPNLEWKGAAASASWWGPPGRVSVWL